MASFNWNPGTLLETSGAYWKTCALHTAVKLDIFSALGTKTMSAKEINNTLNVDMRGLTMLLNALAAMELLQKKEDAYTNSKAAQTFLCRSAKQYIGYLILHHHHLMESWNLMAEGIKTGRPTRGRSSFSDEQRREAFLMGMFNTAMATAPVVSKQIDLSGCTRLLDLGGGPGTYAIHFCLENPQLTAAVFDLETTKPFAAKTIARFNLSDRIEFISGDFTENEIADSGNFDAAWLSHILHGEGPDQAEAIIQKAVNALKPGSPIFIHEFILDNTMDGPLFPALFSLNMYLGTPQGQSYSQQQLTDMLTRCGVEKIRRHEYAGPTQSGILWGITTG